MIDNDVIFGINLGIQRIEPHCYNITLSFFFSYLSEEFLGIYIYNSALMFKPVIIIPE